VNGPTKLHLLKSALLLCSAAVGAWRNHADFAAPPPTGRWGLRVSGAAPPGPRCGGGRRRPQTAL